VAALLEVIRQLTDMNKKGTKRGNTIIFASFDLAEVNGKLNITYLKL
jgi:Zn-dependent M28 family amino/carboxypeptidase